jgi:hypothetical protein
MTCHEWAPWRPACLSLEQEVETKTTRRRFLTLITAGLMMLASGAVMAQNAPAPGSCPNCPTGGVPKRDGTGPGAKRGHRTGPQDGSGPIHTPPNQGRRAGRR